MERYFDECATYYDDEQVNEDASPVRKYVCVDRIAAAIAAHTQGGIGVARVLDVGVGTGLATQALVHQLPVIGHPAREFYGVDLSQGMLDVCRKKNIITHLLPPCDLNKQDLTDVLDGLSFDVIISAGTTEFVHDHARLFRQVATLLVPGTGVFCSTFAANGVAAYADLVHTTEAGLRQLAHAHQLDVHSIERYHGWSATADQHVEYLQLVATSRKATTIRKPFRRGSISKEKIIVREEPCDLFSPPYKPPSTTIVTAASMSRRAEVNRCRARGHKVPSHLEHPLTTHVFLPLCDMVVDALYERGVVPNHVTAMSFVMRMASVSLVFYSGASWTTVVLFLTGYWFDCLDGVLARRHNLVTSFGDVLEHINDVATTCLMCAALLIRYSIHWGWIVAFLVTLLGACIHMGLVERYNCDVNQQGNQANFLYALTYISRYIEPIKHAHTSTDECPASPLPAYNLSRFEHDMLWLMNYTRHATDVTIVLVLTAFMAWQTIVGA
jgi:CDP-diacylglycerol--glycerol-3-phosphate 3-phosphatidyltransferase